MRTAIPLVLLMASGCTPKPAAQEATPAPAAASPTTPGKIHPEFCRALSELVTAADGDFVSLRTGEPSSLMRSWESKVALPGASVCRVADKDPVSFGSVFCVMSESGDSTALEHTWADLTSRATGCLGGWKSGTGEQLGTKWIELEPLPQKSSTRTLVVQVRLVEAKESAKGTVTIDVAVRRPGAMHQE